MCLSDREDVSRALRTRFHGPFTAVLNIHTKHQHGSVLPDYAAQLVLLPSLAGPSVDFDNGSNWHGQRKTLPFVIPDGQRRPLHAVLLVCHGDVVREGVYSVCFGESNIEWYYAGYGEWACENQEAGHHISRLNRCGLRPPGCEGKGLRSSVLSKPTVSLLRWTSRRG